MKEQRPASFHYHTFKTGRGEWHGMIVEWSGRFYRDLWESPEYDEEGIAERACLNRARVLGITVVKATNKAD